MNLIVDENVDKLVVDALRQDGHNVLYVAEFAPSIDDEKVLEQANQNGALLIQKQKKTVKFWNILKNRMNHREI